MTSAPSETDLSEIQSNPRPNRLPPFPHPIWQPTRAVLWLFDVAFGMLSILALLAFLAAIPLVNFLALGYLLDAEGKVARSGRLRDALPLLPLAPKLGGIAVGLWFWLWAVHFVADAASDAELVAPGSRTAAAWRIGLAVFAALTTFHLLFAIARGGRLGLFFWPTPLNAIWLWKRIRQGGYLAASGQSVREFLIAVRPGYHFWLGLRGFFLAFAWLSLPTAFFAALHDTTKPGQVAVTIIGGLLLITALAWVPFLQARFAAENRWRSMFQLRAVRELYRKAPLMMFLAVMVLYGLSLPLYLFKVAALPVDAYWLLTPIFILTIYPARIFVGWAYTIANRREHRAPFILRGLLGLLLIPLLGIYVFALFFTPAIGAAGRAVLFQHHAVLLPWPF